MKRPACLLAVVLITAACGKKDPGNPGGGGASASASGAGSASSGGGAAGSAGSATATGGGSATPADPTTIARGQYVANVAGCTVCHMAFGPLGPEPTQSLAGGFEMPDTFGTWRVPNITQDKATGIGAWTDEQIIKAIREGIRADGTQMFPIMPYPFYNRMTDADARAVVAYLRTLPAIDRKIDRNDLNIPRPTVARPTSAPDPSGSVAHGEYLATLMHCASCHTMMGSHGPDPTRAFAGGLPFAVPMLGDGTVYASNITSDVATGIGAWSEQNVVDAVRKLTRPDGRTVQGPMQLYVAAWSQLTDDDAMALAAYVKSIPAVSNRVPASTFKPTPPAPTHAPTTHAPGAASGSATPDPAGHRQSI